MAKVTKAVAVEDDDDDLELDELEDDEETTPAKKAKGKAKKAKPEDDIFGVRKLIELIEEETEKVYTPREIRTLLRKMAQDGKGRVERQIVAGNKTRYEWTGPTDPEVKRILKAVTGGEVEAGKKEALDKLKASQAAKKAKAPAKAEKGKKAKAVAPPDDEDEDEDEDED